MHLIYYTCDNEKKTYNIICWPLILKLFYDTSCEFLPFCSFQEHFPKMAKEQDLESQVS